MGKVAPRRRRTSVRRRSSSRNRRGGLPGAAPGDQHRIAGGGDRRCRLRSARGIGARIVHPQVDRRVGRDVRGVAACVNVHLVGDARRPRGSRTASTRSRREVLRPAPSRRRAAATQRLAAAVRCFASSASSSRSRALLSRMRENVFGAGLARPGAGRERGHAWLSAAPARRRGSANRGMTDRR